MDSNTIRGIENCVRTFDPIAFALVMMAPVIGLVFEPVWALVVATVGLSQIAATLIFIPQTGDEYLMEMAWDVLTTDAKHAGVAGLALLSVTPVVAMTGYIDFGPLMTSYMGGVAAFSYWFVLGRPEEMDVTPQSPETEADMEVEPQVAD